MAKLIIKLINAVGDGRQSRPAGQRHRLRVVFLPNFNVKHGQRLYPAADLSEQISTAGKEASGTGNMKFSMNGALTIGTLDGANVEIREEVGAENFFLFGLTAEEVAATLADGLPAVGASTTATPSSRRVIDLIGSGFFSHGDRELFRPLIDNLLHHDPYMVLADYRRLRRLPGARSARPTRDQARWTRMSILNVARMGKFSSDRTIREYCRDIWRVEPTAVEV